MISIAAVSSGGWITKQPTTGGIRRRERFQVCNCLFFPGHEAQGASKGEREDDWREAAVSCEPCAGWAGMHAYLGHIVI